MERNNKKPKKKKRKNRKLLTSAAAFITAAVVVVFCCYYIYYRTDFFDLITVTIDGTTYSYEYIMEKSEIELGKKLFEIDRKKVKEKLEKEVYVGSARVVYALPNKIHIEIDEREEKYQIFFNNQYIIIDKDGIVLRTNNERLNLLTIESFVDVVYNVGDTIHFTGIESNEIIFETVEYLAMDFGNEIITSVKVTTANSLSFETSYGTIVKIDLSQDVKYQVVFAMKIINERLNNNLTVSTGLIDFTKGDSPVYIEDFKLEEHNE
ncbi:MAG: FtsQ-type POTRA domain-containing protein [Tissierellia bacterium]|nr:FtsQ-type POTRA domain-containing protein [Tissierellia bacterium]